MTVFAYGISVLHARLKCFKYMLSVAYKMELQKWRVNEAAYEIRKSTIQKQLRKDVGPIADVVRQGFGTTNDGNTARRFF
ncbi:dna-mediated transposase [Lasius niger]|uniref:Dna-mediated transposase n=1 Tax=Lasius niger TaxID=67767 RepID=A0A0J7KG68_LASNI|nr:dna-mediated transposase [Lasius niger]